MKKTSLTRSIPYWVLLALSLAAVIVGGWLVWDNTTTMQTTLLDGTATNIEVYVGQAWITTGAAVLAAGIIGILLALVVAALRALIPAGAPVVVEPIDWTTNDVADETIPEAAEDPITADDSAAEASDDDETAGRGSIATATKTSAG